MEQYLQDSYDITNENKREILESVLAYYFCSWQVLRDILICSNVNIEDFLKSIDNCRTTGEIKEIVNKYI